MLVLFYKLHYAYFGILYNGKLTIVINLPRQSPLFLLTVHHSYFMSTKYFTSSVKPHSKSVHQTLQKKWPPHDLTVTLEHAMKYVSTSTQSGKFLLLNQCLVGPCLVPVEYCVASHGRKKLKINEESEQGYEEKERNRGE